MDSTIKNCYLCSIGQAIIEECKVSKPTPKSKKKSSTKESSFNYKELAYSR